MNYKNNKKNKFKIIEDLDVVAKRKSIEILVDFHYVTKHGYVHPRIFSNPWGGYGNPISTLKFMGIVNSIVLPNAP